MSWVLDASAVLCWLADELGAARVVEILSGEEPVAIHAVNWLEVQYYLLRRSEQAWQIALDRIADVGVNLARDLDDAFLLQAARIKSHQTPIALGDTFAVALAVRRNATLLTTDRAELEKLANGGACAIEFLR